MRWYVNDTSLQGQFVDLPAFERTLRGLLAARNRIELLRANLRTSRIFADSRVHLGVTVRAAVQQSRDRDFRGAVLGWLDRTGPFVEGDRLAERDDYFECLTKDVTDNGLGEAGRRVKSGEFASSYSFSGGEIDFAINPLLVEHGIAEERIGAYEVPNFWTVDALVESAINEGLPATSWQGLVQNARERFPLLLIPDSVFFSGALAREPFDTIIRDRALALLGHLNEYVSGRADNGAEGPIAREIVDRFFVGERALFSGESPTNQREHRRELTFADPTAPDREIFAHWHGKISHRFFRLHFEWPMPAAERRLKIVYLGPKLTKD